MGHPVRQHRLCQRQPDWHCRRIASDIPILAILMMIKHDGREIAAELDQRVPVITKDGKIALVRPQTKRCLPDRRLHRVAKIQLGDGKAPPVIRLLAINQWRERPAIHRVRHRHAQKVQNGRRHINGFGGGGQMRSGNTASGHPDHQRNAKRGIEIMHLAPGVMVAQHLAMIGGDDNDRVVVLAGGFEMGDDSAEMVINLTRQRQIQSPHHRRVFRRRLKVREALHHVTDRSEIHRRAVERMGGAIGISVTGGDRRHHPGRVIHAVIG